VWSRAAKAPMFDDIDMMGMLTTCFHVLVENIRPFSVAAASN
jgi:hypothetical protein